MRRHLVLALISVIAVSACTASPRSGTVGHVSITAQAQARLTRWFSDAGYSSSSATSPLPPDRMAPPPTPEWLLDTSWTRLYRGKVVTHFRVRSKVVALTLDDGPDGSTPKVVAALRQYGAHATFFWRGRGIPAAEASAALLDGDELANHTLNHIELQGSATDTDRQIDEMNEQFERIQGRKPIWVRAAVGRVNGTALREVWARHQLYANWNIHAEDTNWSYGAERIMSNVLGGLQPGAVILMHQTRPDTVKLLPELLKRIEARGYRVVTLSELAWMEASGK